MTAAITMVSVLVHIAFASVLLACRSELRHRYVRSSTSRVEARPTDEPTGDHRHAIDDLERQGRESSRRRTVQDSRAVFEIELREVTRAFDRARGWLPVPDVAPRVRADGGAADASIRPPGPSVTGQIIRTETNEQHLIESRLVANDSGRRIHGVGGERRAGRRHVREGDEPPFPGAAGEHEAIVRLRPSPAWVVRLGADQTGHRGRREAQREREQRTTPRPPRRRGPRRWLVHARFPPR